jgi:hypothetical protein
LKEEDFAGFEWSSALKVVLERDTAILEDNGKMSRFRDKVDELDNTFYLGQVEFPKDPRFKEQTSVIVLLSLFNLANVVTFESAAVYSNAINMTKGSLADLLHDEVNVSATGNEPLRAYIHIHLCKKEALPVRVVRASQTGWVFQLLAGVEGTV